MRRLPMRELPIKRARFHIYRPRLQFARIDARHGRDLLKIAGRENLIRPLEIAIGQNCLDHFDAGRAQKSDDALARHAVEKGSIWRWREDHAVLGHEGVGIGEFRDIAERVEQKAIVEAAPRRLDQRARAIGIEAAGLGVDGRRFGGGTRKGDKVPRRRAAPASAPRRSTGTNWSKLDRSARRRLSPAPANTLA